MQAYVLEQSAPPLARTLHIADTCMHTIAQEDFKSAVVAAEGFEYRPERPNATSFLTQKWAWTGLEPGS